MKHARQQLREAAVSALIDETSAGSNVFNSRVYALDDNSLPAIIVYSLTEASLTDTISYPRSQTRTLTLTIEAHTKAVTDADKLLDMLAMEIEQKIAADPTLSGLAKDTMLISTEINVSGDGDVPIAIGTLTFNTVYRTKETAPETII